MFKEKTSKKETLRETNPKQENPQDEKPRPKNAQSKAKQGDLRGDEDAFRPRVPPEFDGVGKSNRQLITHIHTHTQHTHTTHTHTHTYEPRAHAPTQVLVFSNSARVGR
jgi:hypothetical protein